MSGANMWIASLLYMFLFLLLIGNRMKKERNLLKFVLLTSLSCFAISSARRGYRFCLGRIENDLVLNAFCKLLTQYLQSKIDY